MKEAQVGQWMPGMSKVVCRGDDDDFDRLNMFRDGKGAQSLNLDGELSGYRKTDRKLLAEVGCNCCLIADTKVLD